MLSNKLSTSWVDADAQRVFREARKAHLPERVQRPRQARLPLWLQVDPVLVFCVLALTVFGLVMVYSSSAALAAERTQNSLAFFRIQLIAALLGCAGAVVAMRVPMHVYARNAKNFVLVAIGLMLLVFVPGVSQPTGEFHRWIRLFVFPFQPVELAKLAVVLYVAHFLSSGKKNIRRLFRGVIPNVVVMLIFVGLLLLQPDFGSAVLLCGVVFAMLLAGGARVSHLVILGVLSAIPAYFLVVSDSYRYQRVVSFLQWIHGTAPAPDSKGYQIWQSYNALSSGGLVGTGLGDGIYKLFFLPTPHTDFIFAVTGEELGFIGASSVIGLFALLATRGIQMASRLRDPFMQMVAFGITMTFSLQAIVNIGMVLGLLPTKGFTLPFLSYGGSSLMMSLITSGVLLNVSRYATPEEVAA